MLSRCNRELVRDRPAMFVGDISGKGLHHLAWEIIENSIQEFEAGFATQVFVTLQSDQGLAIEDNGRGIPVDRDEQLSQELGRECTVLEALMTRFDYPSPHRDRYRSQRIFNDVGMVAVNCLSKLCTVEVFRSGKCYSQRYQEGLAGTPVVISDARGRQGTKTVLWADDQIFESVEFEYEVLRTYLSERAYLYPGLQIQFRDEPSGRCETFDAKEGAADFVRFMQRHRDLAYVPTEVVRARGQSSSMQFDVALGYATNVVSFVNGNRTLEGGSHMAAFHQALVEALNEVGRKLGLLHGEVLTREDYEPILAAVVSVRVRNPMLGGATRTRYFDQEIQQLLYQELKKILCQRLEENPVLIRCALENASNRKRQHP